MQDQEFINNFAAVLAALVAIVIFILILAIGLSSKDETMDMAMEKRTQERIAPISRVYVNTAPAEVMAPVAGVEVAVTVTPEEIYQSACQSCHASGILESPLFGDNAAWEPRFAQGLEALYQSVINGKGNMPAKAGRTDLSDETIRLTVDYMLEAAGFSAE